MSEVNVAGKAAQDAWELGRAVFAAYQEQTGSDHGLTLLAWDQLTADQQNVYMITTAQQVYQLSLGVAGLCEMIGKESA